MARRNVTAKKGIVSISIQDNELSEVIDDLLKPTTKQFQIRANKVATAAALDAVKTYYSQGSRNIWINPRLPTHGPGRRPTQWWRGVANGWNAVNIKARSAEIINKTIGLAHKVTGGTIKPKRVPFLTIPIVPEAHGLTVKTFSKTVAPLFRAGKSYAMAKPGGGIKPVFALSKKVTQLPWKKALPPEEMYAKPYYNTLLDEIDDTIAGK